MDIVQTSPSIPSHIFDAMMEDVMKEARRRIDLRSAPYESFKRRYKNEPVKFVKDCIIFEEGDRATFYQLEVLEKLLEHKKVAIRGPRGLGKTAMASWIILWFALTRDGTDWKILTTASVYRQIEEFLWPEIHRWARQIRWSRVGRLPFDRDELMNTKLKLSTGHAFGFASTDQSYVEGGHAKHLLCVFDEAKAIYDKIWNSIEGAFASPQTDEAFALAISTPGEPNGRFYDIHDRQPGLEDWYPIHVTIDEAIRAGRISAKWVKNMKALWGEDSAQYQNHVLGNFATADDEGLIPLHWVESSNNRYEEGVESTDKSIGVGIDIGRTRDQSVIVVTEGPIVKDIHRLPTTDTMGTAGNIINYLRAHIPPSVEPVIDVAGIGAGVVDRLREQGIPVIAYHASESTDFKDKSGELEFLNKRSAGWWRLREFMDPNNESAIAIPRDDILLREITAPHWETTSTGKIKIESKLAIRKRISRSTDTADALIMALFGSELESSFAGGTVGVVSIPRRRTLI